VEMSHLLPLRNRVIGRLRCRSTRLLHLGAGGAEVRREMLSVTVQCERGRERRVLIPASSLKGAFRRRAELVFNSIGTRVLPEFFRLKDEGVEVQGKEVEEVVEWLLDQPKIYEALVSLGFGDDLERLGVKNEEDLRKKWEEREMNQNVKRKFKSMMERYASTLHPVCRLFGTQSMAAKVRFFDVLLDPRLAEKPGIAIERKSLRVKEGHLYFLESLLPQSFSIWFIADNLFPGEEESLLLASTLQSILQVPLTLGAKKSAGMGSIELEGGEFWLIETEKDGEGAILADPFTNSKPLGLSEFLRWLAASLV